MSLNKSECENRKVLVSVVMIMYNTPEEYLRPAVESILNQTFTNFEFIIVDDGSTDDALSVIRSYSDDRIILIQNEENLGQPASRNKGIDAAKGQFIAMMDSDDISMPDRLEKELAFMQDNPDVIVCSAWYEKFGIENRVRKPIIDDFESYRCQLLFSNAPVTLCHPLTMFRKSMLDEYNIRYDVALPYAEDYGLWVICSRFGRIAILEKVLLKYRTHPSQVTTNKREDLADYSGTVSRRQLQELGIIFREEETRWRYNIVTDKNDYLLFYDWLKEIYEANLKLKMFDPESLEAYLEEKLRLGLKHISRMQQIKVWFCSDKRTRRIMKGMAKVYFHDRF